VQTVARIIGTHNNAATTVLEKVLDVILIFMLACTNHE